MAINAIEVVGLSKKFKSDFWKKPVQVLTDVSFSVPENSVCGLIGPNGAGKTSIIKTILSFIRADAGQIKIFNQDHDDPKVREAVGYLPEQAYYYDYLKPIEFLNFYANLFGLSSSLKKTRIESLMNLVGLTGKEDVRLRNFSKGMLQRIGIAQALINDPSLVIFDEPMSGLDPIGRKEVRDIILSLKERGKTVLFSTHILPDVENLSDHAIMIVGGKVKASGTIDQLVQPTIKSYDVLIDRKDDLRFPESWRNHVKVQDFQLRTMLRFSINEEINQSTILDWIQKNHVQLVSLVPYKENLETVLLQNIGAKNA